MSVPGAGGLHRISRGVRRRDAGSPPEGPPRPRDSRFRPAGRKRFRTVPHHSRPGGRAGASGGPPDGFRGVRIPLPLARGGGDRLLRPPRQLARPRPAHREPARRGSRPQGARAGREADLASLERRRTHGPAEPRAPAAPHRPGPRAGEENRARGRGAVSRHRPLRRDQSDVRDRGRGCPHRPVLRAAGPRPAPRRHGRPLLSARSGRVPGPPVRGRVRRFSQRPRGGRGSRAGRAEDPGGRHGHVPRERLRGLRERQRGHRRPSARRRRREPPPAARGDRARPGQEDRPRDLPFLHRIDKRRGLGEARDGGATQEGARPERIHPPLPAPGGRAHGPRGRRRGAPEVGLGGAGIPAAREVHSGRRGERPHRADRRVGARDGLPPGETLAGRGTRRRQDLRQRLERAARERGFRPDGGPGPPGNRPCPRSPHARAHRERPRGGRGADRLAPLAASGARRADRHRRLRHGLHGAPLPQVLPRQRAEDRPFVHQRNRERRLRHGHRLGPDLAVAQGSS